MTYISLFNSFRVFCVFRGSNILVFIRGRQKLCVFVSLCSVKYPCFRAAPYQGTQNVFRKIKTEPLQ